MEYKLVFYIIVCCVYSYMAVLTADKACPYKPMDIVFVLDGSGSEGETNFRTQLQFVSNITQQFEIASNQTRVALLTFSTSVYHQFYLNEFTNKPDVLDRINATDYPNGETNTHVALNAVHYTTLNSFYGGERNVTKLVIVLTDGRSTEPDILTIAAENLKNERLVTVVAVGIGDHVDYSELLTIGTDRNHTYHVPSFNVLHMIQGQLTDTACNTCNDLSNVCFVLDSSGSEGAVNFNKQLEFVQLMINDFSMDIQTAQTHSCVITFSTASNIEIPLDQYTDKNALISNVMTIPYRDGETRTDLGLQDAQTALYPSVGNKVAIVLTDGRSTEPSYTRWAANALHRTGIDVYAVGIGHNVDVGELKVIASDHGHVLQVSGFDHLDDIHEALLSKLCNIRPSLSQTSTSASTLTVPTTTMSTTNLPTITTTKQVTVSSQKPTVTTTTSPKVTTTSPGITVNPLTTTISSSSTNSTTMSTSPAPTTSSPSTTQKPIFTLTPTHSTSQNILETTTTPRVVTTSTVTTTQTSAVTTMSQTTPTSTSIPSTPLPTEPPSSSTVKPTTSETSPFVSSSTSPIPSSTSTPIVTATTSTTIGLTGLPSTASNTPTLIQATATSTTHAPTIPTGPTVLPVVSATSPKETLPTSNRPIK